MKRYIFILIIVILLFNSCSLFQQTKNNSEDRLKNIENEIALLKLSINNYENSLKRINENITVFNEKVDSLSDTIILLKKNINSIYSTMDASNTNIQKILKKYDSELNTLHNSLKNLKTDISNFSNIKDETYYNEIITALDNRLQEISNKLNDLNKNTIKKNEFDTLIKKYITKDSTIFENDKIYVDSKFNLLNKQFEDTIKSLNKDITTLNSSITNINISMFSKYTELLNYINHNKNNFSSVEKNINNLDKRLTYLDKISKHLDNKLSDLEKNIYNITLSSTEIKKSIDISVKENIDNLLKTVNSLDKIWQINFETLEKDLDSLKNDYSTFKNKTDDLINEENLKKYVYSSVEAETQREVAKLFYKTKSEELLKIKNLEEKFAVLDNTIEDLQNSFELLSSRPLNTFDEKFKTKLDELERELTNALISFSNAEIKELFGSNDQIIYKIKSGDTLSQIALAFGLGYNGVDLIKVVNNIDDPRTIRVGQKIIIPVKNIEKFLTWPLSYTLPSNYERIVIRFGDRISTGVSIGLGILPLKDEYIKPALPGKIVDTGKMKNNSYYIKIDHGNGVLTVYSNLLSIKIKNGQWVDNSTIIGTVKKDKLFNFEIWKNGEPKDPMRLFFKYIGDFKATFYTEWDDKIIYYPAFRLTKSQKVPRPWVTVAADPDFLPLGTVIYIPEFRNSPNYGFFEIEDIGSKIIGNKLDIYINDVRFAQNTKNVNVYVVGKKSRR
ncbi:peptidoglycan-binding protein [Marinitoga sp. 1197]|uniref:peptidoglycan DD-metalloendopeptidase family protein n=1 Tax=Marinitoga sp. 1197 TaxID=1428449 RepID=UPI0006597E40|nr:peptidoglycan DD-metalloendopeptidase family protein [Marinitoga sp. 1197]KLO22694.1 peptidoglycan-binding protein [Marinitoga sp. 1197]